MKSRRCVGTEILSASSGSLAGSRSDSTIESLTEASGYHRFLGGGGLEPLTVQFLLVVMVAEKCHTVVSSCSCFPSTEADEFSHTDQLFAEVNSCKQTITWSTLQPEEVLVVPDHVELTTMALAAIDLSSLSKVLESSRRGARSPGLPPIDGP